MSMIGWIQLAGTLAIIVAILLVVCGAIFAFFVVRYIVKKIKEDEEDDRWE